MIRHQKPWAALAVLVISATSALAGNGPVNGWIKGHDVQAAKCPPGLAKKSPPCVPPGQAKARDRGSYVPYFRIGDRIDRDFIVIDNPRRYGLVDDYLYYLVGREVFRVAPETGRVIAFISLADALLN